MMKLDLNISPCPNDTFMFEAMINGRIDTEGLSFNAVFSDIEKLNESILKNTTTHISKISYAVLPLITDRYILLRSGSALGRGNGPLLVSKAKIKTEDLNLKIAVPGIYTTANLLMQRIFPRLNNRVPVLFSEIAERVARGEFDAGVLIHEGRFTYREKNLRLLADLGQEWERIYKIPLPLGGIVVSRDIGKEIRIKIERVLGRSIKYALENPQASSGFVKTHAQELSEEVINKHIKLFVNEYSLDMGTEGTEAVNRLTGIQEEKLFI